MLKVRSLVLMLVAVLALAGASIPVSAANANYTAHLTADQETGAVESRAQGQFILRLQDDGTFYYKLIVANIENVRAAHIHLGAPGQNGHVLVGLYSNPTGTGRFSGVLAEGEFTPTQEFLTALEAGNLYVNVHTLQYGGGEIRGQVR
ncbi:MAG: CHRD domain-containing protein [Chloroflexota bacterium]|nr:CHRD domain-containing protein [Chloroflexota bacterium]